MHANLCFAAHVFGGKFRRLLEGDHAHVLVAALQGTVQGRIHALVTLAEFVIALALFTAVSLFESHFNRHLFALGLQGTQVLDCRFKLNIRVIEIVVHLELHKFLDQGIQSHFTGIEPALEINS